MPAVRTKTQSAPKSSAITADVIECVTQAEKDIQEAAPYLAVCRPCLDLGVINGWIVEVTE